MGSKIPCIKWNGEGSGNWDEFGSSGVFDNNSSHLSERISVELCKLFFDLFF